MKSCLAVIDLRKMWLAAVGAAALSLGYSAASLAAATPAAGSAAAIPSVTVPVPVVSAGKASPPTARRAAPAPTTGKAASSQPAAKPALAQTPVRGFVGAINTSHVNVRGGPGLAYYVLGQLNTGDMVDVVGSGNGWDAIEPPAGTLCYIAKKYVHVGTDTSHGRVSANYVYVRAASWLAPHSDFAVVKVASRGTHVHIVGKTASFYVIQAPRGAHVYVLGKFVTSAGADAQYLAPQLQMPAWFKGSTLAASLTSGNSAVLSSAAGKSSPATTTQPGVGNTVPLPVVGKNSGSAVVVPPVTPVGNIARNAQISIFSRFSALNKKTQLQFQEPLIQRQLQPLLRGYEKLAGVAGAPAWIKQGIAARISVLKRAIAIQQLLQASRNTPPVSKVIAPYQQQWRLSQKQIAQALDRAPYVAKGVLRTSTALKSKYALVNPANGRVTAYIDPTSRIALSRLLGEYIGIKGVVTGGGTVVKLIRVATATLLPEPEIKHLSPTAGRHHP